MMSPPSTFTAPSQKPSEESGLDANAATITTTGGTQPSSSPPSATSVTPASTKSNNTSDQKVSSSKKRVSKKNANQQPASKKAISLKTKLAFKFGTFNKMPILSSVVKSNPILVKLTNPKTYNRIRIKTIRKHNKTVIVITKRKLFRP